MRNVLAYLLAAVLLLSLFTACSGEPQEETQTTTVVTTTSTTMATTTTNGEVVFEKPASYAAVVLVSINPQFKLYLDADGAVLAVEPVNADAKQVAANITTKTGSVETVVDHLISAANDDGFVKQDVTVNIEVTEIYSETVDTVAVLEKAKTGAETQLQRLNVQAQVETAVAEDAVKVDPTTTEAPDVTETTTNATTTVTTTATTTTTGTTTVVTEAPTTTTTTNTTTTTQAPSYTAVKQMDGYWAAMYLDGNTLQDVSLALVGELSIGLGIGDPLSEMPEEMREEMKPDCVTFQGEYYYIGRGDGDEIASVVENGVTVTVKDTSGNSLTLTRISETELQVADAVSAFSVVGAIPKGVVFTYRTLEE